MIKAETNIELSLENYQDRQIVFFDGVCNFCNNTVDLIWRNNREKDFYYSSLQSDFANKFLKQFNIENADLVTLYFFDGTKIHDRSRAVGKILSRLDSRLYRFLGTVLLLIPKFLADPFYLLFAKNRYKITGKRDNCRVPSSEEKTYFLE